MANTLTGLIPVIYKGLDVVSRELSGFTMATRRNSTAEVAAKDQTVRIPVTPAQAAEDITPGQLPADTGSQTIGYTDMVLDKSRAVPILWNGEEKMSQSNGVEAMYNTILADQFAQAFRTLTNEIEADVAAEYVEASRAVGTSGTTPFASNIAVLADARQVLSDNGAPLNDLQCVVDTLAGANLRSLTQLTNVNEAGTEQTLRQGRLLPLLGFDMRESGQVASHTKGDGTGFVTDLGATLAVGDVTIHVDTGTEEIKAGDVVTFVGDTNQYVVKTGHDAGAGATEGDIVIAEPGLRQTLADGVAMTITDTYTANMAFARSAIILATRAPAMPDGGDGADEHMIVQDPFSGLAFDIGLYRQYHQVKYEVSATWGAELIKPEHVAIIKG